MDLFNQDPFFSFQLPLIFSCYRRSPFQLPLHLTFPFLAERVLLSFSCFPRVSIGDTPEMWAFQRRKFFTVFFFFFPLPQPNPSSLPPSVDGASFPPGVQVRPHSLPRPYRTESFSFRKTPFSPEVRNAPPPLPVKGGTRFLRAFFSLFKKVPPLFQEVKVLFSRNIFVTIYSRGLFPW